MLLAFSEQPDTNQHFIDAHFLLKCNQIKATYCVISNQWHMILWKCQDVQDSKNTALRDTMCNETSPKVSDDVDELFFFFLQETVDNIHFHSVYAVRLPDTKI